MRRLWPNPAAGKGATPKHLELLWKLMGIAWKTDPSHQLGAERSPPSPQHQPIQRYRPVKHGGGRCSSSVVAKHTTSYLLANNDIGPTCTALEVFTQPTCLCYFPALGGFEQNLPKLLTSKTLGLVLPVHHIPMCDELDVVSTTALEVNQLIAGPSTMSFQLTA